MASEYNSCEWPAAAKCIEGMPKTRSVTFQTKDKSVGEGEVLHAYRTWSFRLAKLKKQNTATAQRAEKTVVAS